MQKITHFHPLHPTISIILFIVIGIVIVNVFFICVISPYLIRVYELKVSTMNMEFFTHGWFIGTTFFVLSGIILLTSVFKIYHDWSKYSGK